VHCEVHGHVLRSSCNLPVLYSYCNSFFIHDIHREFGLINVHLFDILLVISSGKVRDLFFCLESGNRASIEDARVNAVYNIRVPSVLTPCIEQSITVDDILRNLKTIHCVSIEITTSAFF